MGIRDWGLWDFVPGAASLGLGNTDTPYETKTNADTASGDFVSLEKRIHRDLKIKLVRYEKHVARQMRRPGGFTQDVAETAYQTFFGDRRKIDAQIQAYKNLVVNHEKHKATLESQLQQGRALGATLTENLEALRRNIDSEVKRGETYAKAKAKLVELKDAYQSQHPNGNPMEDKIIRKLVKGIQAMQYDPAKSQEDLQEYRFEESVLVRRIADQENQVQLTDAQLKIAKTNHILLTNKAQEFEERILQKYESIGSNVRGYEVARSLKEMDGGLNDLDEVDRKRLREAAKLTQSYLEDATDPKRLVEASDDILAITAGFEAAQGEAILRLPGQQKQLEAARERRENYNALPLAERVKAAKAITSGKPGQAALTEGDGEVTADEIENLDDFLDSL